MKTFDQLREGFVSAAQRKAVWASKADGGKGHPDNKKKKSKKEDVAVKEQDEVNELDTSTLVSYRKKANKQRYSNNISKRTQRTAGVDRADKKLRKRNIDKFGDHSPKGVDRMGNRKEDTSDAVKAFLAKGGKIKKLAPAKAQGYHGKDDPGKGMHGMMDKPDTKAMGTRKKVKSMEATENYQVQKYTKGKKDGPAKSFGGDLKKATAHASKMGDDHRVHKEGLGDMIRTGARTAANSVASAINNRRSKFGTSGGAKSASQMRGEEVKPTATPPFDKAKPIQKDTKDKFGNPIKNRAKHLARKAARSLLNKEK
jgi:hypothetical protein